MAGQPQGRLGDLPLLTPAERQQLLVEWNDTATEYPRHTCLHQLFEEQVDRTPDSVAVVFEGQQLSYRDLNARANELAHYLKMLGVRAETLVAICVERSVEMVVGILGILKAGGAYVPLDPAYPKDRLAFTINDCQPRVLLTQQTLAASLPAQAARMVCLDSDWREIAAAPESDLASAAGPANLAYVIYTSGSTGRPKGVTVPHRAVVNFLGAMQQQIRLTEHDILLAVTTLSFDIAGLDLFLPLTVGARVVIAKRETAADGSALVERLTSSGATILQATPVTWRLLRETGWKKSPHLKILSGGEALPPDLAHHLLGAGESVWNLYGPTETTIYSTAYRITSLDQKIVIGRPIANTQIYILDTRFQPVPVGVAGELHIGGDGLARGYLNRPELTAEKFIANPFSSEPGARLYKTGDLARYLSNGNIECLGRLDHQVKIRGFRIELGEIESHLRRHPAIQDVVAVAREDAPGDKRLVAYLVPQSAETPPAVAELRRELLERLPDYMVPSAFVFLDALPLTPNGKVDRKALRAPDESRPDLATDFVAPRNRVEESLAAIWRELLGIEQVGIHDNFFALGGHSLLAATIQSRMASVSHVNLPLRKLFEAPTIAELSSEIEAIRSGGQIFPSEPLQRIDRNGVDRLPLSFAQERLWFLDQLERGSATYNISWTVRLHGRLNFSALERSLQEVVRRHEVLRTTCVAVDGVPQAVVREPAAFRLTVTDLRGVPDTDREAQAAGLASEEAGRPFDLGRDLMLRAQLLQLGDQNQVLILTMHHVASDGWSLGVFGRELTALYEAFSQDQPSPLPELPIQYQDYAVWQRKWLQGDVLAQQLAYWKEQLAGAPATLELPTDFPRPPVASYRGARREVVLDAKLTQALQMLSRREAVTPFMLLLAAWQVLLARYSGQEDVSVGAPIAGRNRTELEGLIGFFVNTLVLRTNLSGNPTFRELLQREREVTLGAYAHQDLPFEKLVEELQSGAGSEPGTRSFRCCLSCKTCLRVCWNCQALRSATCRSTTRRPSSI